MKKIKLDGAWLHVLNLIQQKDPAAIIAGGAIRDTYLGERVNDIDFYTNAHLTMGEWHELLELDDGDVIRVIGDGPISEPPAEIFRAKYSITANADDSSSSSKASGDSCKFIDYVIEVWKNNETVNQIIVLHNHMKPKHYVEHHFDLGICKTWADGKRIHFSSEFMSDVQNNTLTLCGIMDMQQLYRCLHGHVRKMSNRYPKRTIVLNLDKVIGEEGATAVC